MRTRGFTLLELVTVIVITGILAASATAFLKPSVDAYQDVFRRAALTDMADTALRRMSTDIRSAVPNSIRSISGSCLQLVPTIDGGRYRMAADTLNDVGIPCQPSATCSAPLDPTQASTLFDVLSPLSAAPQANDWVVIDNQNTNDVYVGTNRSQITGISPSPNVALPRAGDGRHRISIRSRQFPAGNYGGRFVIVANAEQSVHYHCVGTTLYRSTSTFAQASPDCNLVSNAAVVATNVSRCTFAYSPAFGMTQQNGFVWIRLELSLTNERISLVHGVHIDNVP